MGKFIAGFSQNPTFKNKSIVLSFNILPNILAPENPDFPKFPTGVGKNALLKAHDKGLPVSFAEN